MSTIRLGGLEYPVNRILPETKPVSGFSKLKAIATGQDLASRTNRLSILKRLFQLPMALIRFTAPVTVRSDYAKARDEAVTSYVQSHFMKRPQAIAKVVASLKPHFDNPRNNPAELLKLARTVETNFSQACTRSGLEEPARKAACFALRKTFNTQLLTHVSRKLVTEEIGTAYTTAQSLPEFLASLDPQDNGSISDTAIQCLVMALKQLPKSSIQQRCSTLLQGRDYARLLPLTLLLNKALHGIPNHDEIRRHLYALQDTRIPKAPPRPQASQAQQTDETPQATPPQQISARTSRVSYLSSTAVAETSMRPQTPVYHTPTQAAIPTMQPPPTAHTQSPFLSSTVDAQYYSGRRLDSTSPTLRAVYPQPAPTPTSIFHDESPSRPTTEESSDTHVAASVHVMPTDHLPPATQRAELGGSVLPSTSLLARAYKSFEEVRLYHEEREVHQQWKVQEERKKEALEQAASRLASQRPPSAPASTFRNGERVNTPPAATDQQTSQARSRLALQQYAGLHSSMSFEHPSPSRQEAINPLLEREEFDRALRLVAPYPNFRLEAYINEKSALALSAATPAPIDTLPAPLPERNSLNSAIPAASASWGNNPTTVQLGTGTPSSTASVQGRAIREHSSAAAAQVTVVEIAPMQPVQRTLTERENRTAWLVFDASLAQYIKKVDQEVRQSNPHYIKDPSHSLYWNDPTLKPLLDLQNDISKLYTKTYDDRGSLVSITIRSWTDIFALINTQELASHQTKLQALLDESFEIAKSQQAQSIALHTVAPATSTATSTEMVRHVMPANYRHKSPQDQQKMRRDIYAAVTARAADEKPFSIPYVNSYNGKPLTFQCIDGRLTITMQNGDSIFTIFSDGSTTYQYENVVIKNHDTLELPLPGQQLSSYFVFSDTLYTRSITWNQKRVDQLTTSDNEQTISKCVTTSFAGIECVYNALDKISTSQDNSVSTAITAMMQLLQKDSIPVHAQAALSPYQTDLARTTPGSETTLSYGPIINSEIASQDSSFSWSVTHHNDGSSSFKLSKESSGRFAHSSAQRELLITRSTDGHKLEIKITKADANDLQDHKKISTYDIVREHDILRVYPAGTSSEGFDLFPLVCGLDGTIDGGPSQYSTMSLPQTTEQMAKDLRYALGIMIATCDLCDSPYSMVIGTDGQLRSLATGQPLSIEEHQQIAQTTGQGYLCQGASKVQYQLRQREDHLAISYRRGKGR